MLRLRTGEAVPHIDVGPVDAGPACALEDIRSVLAMTGGHWRITIPTAVVVMLIGALGVIRKVVPSYRAEAVLLVHPTVPVLAHTGEEWRAESIVGFYGDYVRTLRGIVVEPGVLEQAIDELDREHVEWCPESVAQQDRVNHLRARLDVSHIRDSYLLAIAFEDGVPAVTAEVVNAVTRTFLQTLSNEQRRGSLARLELLKSERERIQKSIDDNRLRLSELSTRTGFAVLDERHNVFYERLIRLQDGLTDVFVDRVRAEGSYEASLAKSDELRATLPAGEIQRLVDDDVVIRDARLMLQRLARDLESETGDLSEDHPLRTQAQERLCAARRRLAEIESSTLECLRQRTQQEREEAASQLVGNARRELESARKSEVQMQGVVAEAEEGLKAYERAALLGRGIRADADRLLLSLEMVSSRIEELLLESQAPDRVTLRTSAAAPTKPVRDRARLFLALVVVAGAVSAVASALATDLLARLRRPGPVVAAQ